MKAAVKVLDPTYENETGVIEYVSPNDGYPVVKVRLDSTGQSIFCFINEVEVIE